MSPAPREEWHRCSAFFSYCHIFIIKKNSYTLILLLLCIKELLLGILQLFKSGNRKDNSWSPPEWTLRQIRWRRHLRTAGSESTILHSCSKITSSPNHLRVDRDLRISELGSVFHEKKKSYAGLPAPMGKTNTPPCPLNPYFTAAF